VILTANYAFLNYLVLALGVLLLDDKFLLRFVPARFRPREAEPVAEPELEEERPLSIVAANEGAEATAAESEPNESVDPRPAWRRRLALQWRALGVAFAAVMLAWIAYDTTAEMIGIAWQENPLPVKPILALEPLRIANQYGLFAVMTRNRYEIEFQGSNDGTNWTAYPFRNKPQALNEAPGIYAPYQPRFDWNLWFASLGSWRENDMVPITEERLLVGDKDVLSLFRSDPFPQIPPRYVRAVLWQYWFTSMEEKRRTGNWWRRQDLGLYAPELTMTADGHFGVVQWPEEAGPRD